MILCTCTCSTSLAYYREIYNGYTLRCM
uniref:Uncharacterized protein n=1 Tax=Anguilla anguilla TaxID=7936 RepID=A0A0E9XMB0_ANGAN